MSESRGSLSRLQELILTRQAALGERGKPLSNREVARRGGFSTELLGSIINGKHRGGLTDRVARGLAHALEVPVEDVYEAAGAPAPVNRWLWPAKFDRLDLAQRQLVEDVASALMAAYEKGREVERGRLSGRDSS